jgi:hypothetical protein
MTLFQLATKPRHQFSAQQHTPADPATGTPERFVWTCQACTLKRITVIPTSGCAYRAYAWGDGIAFEADVEPACGQVGRVSGGEAA